MSYCLHPDCPNPQNSENQKVCCSCGTKLLIKSRYRAMELTSGGKFVRIFQGFDEDKEQQVYIKQIRLPIKILRDRNKRQKINALFERTAQSFQKLKEAASLHMPLDHSILSNGLYLIEEPVTGESVSEIIRKSGPFKEKQIRQLLEDLLLSLVVLHDNDLIHRDLKPDHIFYDNRSGKFLLTNFGIPQMVAEYLRGELAGGEYLVGDPSYSAPEQISGQAAPTSDLYSLGVVCLKALTTLEPIELMDGQGSGWAYQEHLAASQVSAQLQQVIEKMACPSALDRYIYAQDALAQLANPTSSRMKNFTSAATKVPFNLLKSGVDMMARRVGKNSEDT
jgi:serine/threonine protein kinase